MRCYELYFVIQSSFWTAVIRRVCPLETGVFCGWPLKSLKLLILKMSVGFICKVFLFRTGKLHSLNSFGTVCSTEIEVKKQHRRSRKTVFYDSDKLLFS